MTRVHFLPVVAPAIAFVAFNAMTATLDRPDADRLWRVERFAEWANVSVPTAYYQIAKGRVPGVIRFGKTIRIDPEVALPALRQGTRG